MTFRCLVLCTCVCLISACGSDTETTTASPDAASTEDTVGDGGPTPTSPSVAVSLEGIDSTCTADEDCRFVCTRDTCGGCDCGSASIRQDAYEALEAAKAALQETDCPPAEERISCSVWPEPTPAPLCLGGTCDLNFNVTADGLDTSCTEDSDCAVVIAGSPCTCACTPSAISATETSAFQTRFENMRFYCEEPELEIDCGFCPEASVTCNAGTCEIKAD